MIMHEVPADDMWAIEWIEPLSNSSVSIILFLPSRESLWHGLWNNRSMGDDDGF